MIGRKFCWFKKFFCNLTKSSFLDQRKFVWINKTFFNLKKFFHWPYIKEAVFSVYKFSSRAEILTWRRSGPDRDSPSLKWNAASDLDQIWRTEYRKALYPIFNLSDWGQIECRDSFQIRPRSENFCTTSCA